MDSDLGIIASGILDRDLELEDDLDEEMYGFLKKMETEQLREMNQRICAMLKDRRRSEEREAATSFEVGDRIQFRSKKYNRVVEGTIERKNLRTVSLIDCSDGILWRVPYHNLEMVWPAS